MSTGADMKPKNGAFQSHVERDYPNGLLESWSPMAGNQGQNAVVNQQRLRCYQETAIKGSQQ